jgi:hypothetical protein
MHCAASGELLYRVLGYATIKQPLDCWPRVTPPPVCELYTFRHEIAIYLAEMLLFLLTN